jgi:putative photosynthetic complex assembly protein
MSETHADAQVPRLPLMAAGALALCTLMAVAMVRMTGIGAMPVEDAAPVSTREFRFEDRANGSIVILNAADGRLVDTVAPESNGFLRGTMRGLARERKRQGVGPEVAFRLIGLADGRLTLLDPGTGRRVDLESFGPTNAAVFARLMQIPAATRAP